MGRLKENFGTKEDLAMHRLQTAKSNLKSARILFEAKEYKSANNRAYYAVFHAINAIHALMLMYGKEASNRKQEIDRQHHTIPNKRTKDQKTSTVEMCITCYSVMEKSVHRTWKS